MSPFNASLFHTFVVRENGHLFDVIAIEQDLNVNPDGDPLVPTGVEHVFVRGVEDRADAAELALGLASDLSVGPLFERTYPDRTDDQGYIRTYFTTISLHGCVITAVHCRAHRGGCLYSGFVEVNNNTLNTSVTIDTTAIEVSPETVSAHAKRTIIPIG